MAFFNFWSKPSNGSPVTNGQSLGATMENGQPEIPEKVFIEKDGPNQKVDTATALTLPNNIDMLFSFMDKNFEEMGYNDALVNPDSSHLEQNINALKNQLERTIRKVKTFYEDFIREINFHIGSRGRNGMVDTVDELQMKKDIAESHIKKVLEIEADALKGIGDSQGILLSYTRGFKNGLAAISHHSIIKRKF